MIKKKNKTETTEEPVTKAENGSAAPSANEATAQPQPESEGQANASAAAAEEKAFAEEIQALIAASDKACRERDEYLNLAQRLQADFDNFRRRNQNIRQDAYDAGSHDMLVKLLPVFDNLERAVAATGSADALRDGVQMVLRQLSGVLGAAGVEEIPAEGQAFAPNLHNAVMQEETPDVESGIVTAVLQKGYRVGSKILRHSMVKVSQ